MSKNLLLQTTVVILFMTCNYFSHGQIEIVKNGNFLLIDGSERYVVYFESTSGEADEFKEGSVFVYDIQEASSIRINQETYILDLIDVALGDRNFFFISNGRTIKKCSFTSRESQLVYEATSDEVIRNFSISEDRSLLVITLLNISSNVYRVMSYKINDRLSRQVFSQKFDSKGEFLRIETLTKADNIYLLNINSEILCVNASGGKPEVIDQHVVGLLDVGDANLYYSKKNVIVEYTLSSKKKLEIIRSDDLRVSFLSTYEQGLFICFNDNVFVYNKLKETIKKVEELPKNKYLFFSKKLAIYSGRDHSLHIINNQL